MLIMYLIWEILLVVFYLQMCMLDLKDYKEIMFFIFVALMNTVLLLKLRHYNKIRHQNKFVTITMQSIKMFMNGLILVLTILVELLLNGIQQYARKYSLIYKKMEKL